MMREYLRNRIFIIDNVLSCEECDQLIKYYHTYGPTKEFCGTYAKSIHPDDIFPISKVNKIVSSVNSQLEVKINLDWCEIVKWPPGSRKQPHFDLAKDQTVFSSITYLNDDYKGGETFIENDLKCVPKKGRTFCFDGQYYSHGVEKIKRKDRYTIPIWYK
tara:strand:- start:31 stop:510 length:480 start_codon:yes stop_codon:yes gene_type:complete